MKDQKLNVLVVAGGEHDPKISEGSVCVAVGHVSRTQAMIALKALGFTFEEIGAHYDVTRQRVEQLVPGGPKATPRNKEQVTVEALSLEIWQAACHDLAWWGETSGRMIKVKIEQAFYDKGYTWKRARELASSVNVSKTDVILRGLYGVEPTEEAKVAWFAEQMTTRSKDEIFDFLNKGQVLQLKIHTFMRTWRAVLRKMREDSRNTKTDKFSTW